MDMTYYEEVSKTVESMDLAEVYVVMPNFQIIRERVPMFSTMWDIQQKVAQSMNLPAKDLYLEDKERKLLQPWEQVFMLAPSTMNSFVLSAHCRLPLRIPHAEDDSESKIINVKVRSPDTDEVLTLRVLVENQSFFREWCGGYRSKTTGVLYFHAWTQTLRADVHLDVARFNKNCLVQTPAFPLVDQAIETNHSVGTQTHRYDLYQPTYGDRIIEPKEYFPHFFFAQKFNLNVTMMQRFRRRCGSLMKERRELELKKRNEELIRMTLEESKRFTWKYVIDSIYPINKEGFKKLYDLLDVWYNKENGRLSQVLGTSQQNYKAHVFQLYLKKVRLLREIEKLKRKQENDYLRLKEMKKFEAAGKSKSITFPKGTTTIIDSISSQTAKEFKALYTDYIKKDYTKNERIHILLEIKYFLHCFEDLDLTLPIIELLEREIDLTNMDNKYLDGLQNRVSCLLYNFLTHPMFHLKGFRDIDDMPEVTYQCPSCRELKPPSGFKFTSQKSPKYCTSCSWLLDRSLGELGLEPYMRMLQQIRYESTPSKDTVPFLMKPTDVQRIVWDIWNGRSILSSGAGLDELMIPKWDRTRSWSPWNCVVLTTAETAVHRTLEDPLSTYSTTVKEQVTLKLKHGRRLFKHLAHNESAYKKAHEREEKPYLNLHNYVRKSKSDLFFHKTQLKVRAKYLM